MERLQPIPTFTGYYLDTKTLEIYSLKRKEIKKISKTLCKNGYNYVCFTNERSKQRSIPVHQVVWLVFYGEHEKYDMDGNRLCINHINEDKSMNTPENLELVTWKKNVENNLRKKGK